MTDTSAAATAAPGQMPAHIQDLADFVTASPSSYHAAEEVARRLEAVGFTRLDEHRDFPAAPGGYVVVRDGAAMAWIIPTTVGTAASGEAAGGGEGADVVPVFRVLGTHTDSPGFKLKPNHATVTADGWAQAGVEIYGGPLLNSWLDRELRFAGRLALADGRQVLAATGPLGRIPQLAIHLDRQVNEGLQLQRQKHMHPVVGAAQPGNGSLDGPVQAHLCADVLSVLAEAAGVEPEAIMGHDVMVADAQAPGLFGANGEFLASGRLDNLASTHAGLVALERLAGEGEGVEFAGRVADGIAGEAAGAPVIPMLAAFDHEELGSASRSGAAGPILEEMVGRIQTALGVDGQARARSIHGSWLLSADTGHLVHPNYAERHDPANHPRPNGGMLLKINANQRYATDAAGEAAFARWSGVAGVPFQEFVSNNDSPCGSTIGPISATRLGIRTVDVGIGLLSMHSAREMCGVEDIAHMGKTVDAFYAGV
ncbi:aspartyl aminopeptidase [Micrococcus lylae]|uniref:M18 family aminopeptidase n=1 Tax=Micrococcus lylae TaxID=1273 RepID=A0A1R4J588_9MICC|nr:M18 family aminopeptidase [Micrococcus lylae]SJN27192.1 aspartyl aminopeptidase [Micrococcus lylae]